MTNGGVDYSFECIGNVNVMREALECCHMGWGVSTIIGVAGAGQEISHPALSAGHRPHLEGHSFWRRQGPQRIAGLCRDDYMNGEIELDRMVTHTHAAGQISTGPST